MIDMQKARDAAQYDDYKALQMFPAALDEIDRLRARGRELSHITKFVSDNIKRFVLSSSDMTKEALDMVESLADEIDRLNERVSDLEESLTIAYMLGSGTKEKEIDRLREALIEERAMKLMTEHNTSSPIKDMVDFLGEARQQLDAEGKI